MRRALDLAWRGWGRVHPNPMVGAVVLHGGEIVGEGFHAAFGERHAEPAALAEAGDRARGATVVVTLEPCVHVGKQPPCVDALLAAGVRRVVIALADPNPAAAGGAARLRAAGVEVELGLCAGAAAAQNAVFLAGYRRPERPFVALKLATSIDARIADAGRRSKWISGSVARDYVQWLRAGFDAVAVGGGTARDDDPHLTARGAVVPRVPPIRVVFSRSLDLRPDARLVTTARETPTMVITVPARAASAAADALRRAGVDLLASETPAEALAELGRRGITSVLVEGGGELAGALLAASLVDRLYWIQSPLWLGEAGVPAFGSFGAAPLEAAERWHPVDRRPLGDDTLLVLDRPCSPAS